MSTYVPHGRKLLLFLGLNLLDLALSRWLIHPGSPELREVNPVASWALSGGGWAGLASFKLAMVLLAATLFIVISHYRPGTGARVLNLSCLAVGVVVVYSGYLVASNGVAVADLDRKQKEDEELQQEFRKAAADRAVLQGLAGDLAAGRCTLTEASAHWRRCKAADPIWLPRLRAALGRNSDAECVALVLIRHAVFSVESDPAAARLLVDRMAADFEKEFGTPLPNGEPVGAHPGNPVSDLLPPP
jgi:uncharacterized protein DUF5658